MILPAQAGAECHIGGMSQITLGPIGYVRNHIREAKEDYWGDVPSVIEMGAEQFGPHYVGLDDFSHVEVLFHLSGVEDEFPVTGERHPGGNPDRPLTGVFAQRGKARPIESPQPWSRGLMENYFLPNIEDGK